VAHALLRAAPALVPALSAVIIASSLHAQGAVEGKVIATTNGAPVHKATVLLRPARIVGSDEEHPRDSYLTQSGSNGNFSITGMVPGTYQCVPSRMGFGSQPPGAMASTRYYPLVKVEDGKTAAGVVVKLMPLGVIYGRVLDADGDPVAHTVVTASVNGYGQGKRERQEQSQTQTNDRGEYRLYNLFPGKYYVEAMGSGNQYAGPQLRGPQPLALASTFYPSTVDPDQAAPVELAAGAEQGSIDVRMRQMRVFAIRGKLPPPDATQSFGINAQPRRPSQNRMSSGFTMSPRGGQWEIQGLEPGSYLVTLMRFETENGRMVPNNTRSHAVVEVADHDVEGVEFISDPDLEITGALQSTGAKPAPPQELQVSLNPVNGGPNFSSPVKADGSFSLSNVLPDIYSVRVDPTPTVYTVSIKLGSQELPNGEVDLRHGGGPLTVVVANDFAEVEGKVTDADGNPDPSTNVTFVPDQKRVDWPLFFRNQLADSQGHFLLSSIPPGTYTVFAWKDAPRGAPRDPDFRKPFEKLGISVTLAPGGHQSLDLKSIVTQ